MVSETDAQAAPIPLEAAVAEYRARVASGKAPPERVAVELTRERGFVNRGRTHTGHAIAIDEPYDFGGEGAAADPAELLLAAVGASLSVTITAHAALRSLRIDALRMNLSAWMDPAAFFAIGGAVAAGAQEVTIRLDLHSPESEEELRQLVDDAARASPVVASLASVPAIDLQVVHEA
jgi:uncharacterized OsmC-like protein